MAKTINSIKRVLNKFVDDWELVSTSSSVFSVSSANGKFEIGSEIGVSQTGIRLIKDGVLSYMAVNGLDSVDVVRHGLKLAVKSGVKSDIEAFYSSNYNQMPDVNIKKTSSLMKQLSNIVKKAQKIVSSSSKVSNFSISINFSSTEKTVLTKLMDSSVKRHIDAISFTVYVNSKDFDFKIFTVEPKEEEILYAIETFINSLPKKPVYQKEVGFKGEIDVVFHPVMVDSLIKGLFAYHVYYDNVMVNNSRLHVNDKVAPAFVNISDDALNLSLLSAFPCDDEAVPSRKNMIVDKGIFKSYLSSRAVARKANIKSTGNGMRYPVLSEPWNKAPIRSKIRALVIENGKRELEDIILRIQNGLIVNTMLGLHTANPLTGDFANPLLSAYIVVDGEIIGYAAPGTWMIKGNIFDILKDTQGFSKERLNLGSSLLPYWHTRIKV